MVARKCLVYILSFDGPNIFLKAVLYSCALRFMSLFSHVPVDAVVAVVKILEGFSDSVGLTMYGIIFVAGFKNLFSQILNL